ncbi:hypothetical protein [Paludisphaera sp.]|uniref:hypothetical protein n=1 Tax=Paludisphaera sp. TaxID=2017432 RepID=UPI00301D9464
MSSQPRPRQTRVDTFVGPDGEPFSFITRIWKKKDAKACELCPECNRKSLSLMSLCAVVTPGFISDEDAEGHRFGEGDFLPDTTVEVRLIEDDDED